MPRGKNCQISEVVRGHVLGRELRADVPNIKLARMTGSKIRLDHTHTFHLGCGEIVKKRLEGISAWLIFAVFKLCDVTVKSVGQ